MTSELMRATVADPQGDAREGGAERSGRQIRDHRNTNWQRGRLWAASVLGNAKPYPHQDTAGRARWNAEKVQVLTRGDLFDASQREVSRGRSSVDGLRKQVGAKGRRFRQQRSTEHCLTGNREPRRQQAVGAMDPDSLCEPQWPGRCSRRKPLREGHTRRGA
jgi:hypothetical protein